MMPDLVCWDFGNTLVDELFMRIAPSGVAEWGDAYEQALRVDPTYVERLNLGQAALADMIPDLSRTLSIEAHQVARHLRAVFHQIEWLPHMKQHLTELNGQVLQAIVTVNPHEFGAMAVACGLEPLVDVIVTSADVGSLSKPVMARRARRLLGLSDDLSTTLLVDNKAHNTDDFVGHGGRAIHYSPATFAKDWSKVTWG